MNKERSKRYLKWVFTLIVAVTLAFGLSSSAQADTIAELQAKIQEKQNAINQAEQEKSSLQSGLTDVEKIKKELEASKANLTSYVTELDANVTAIQAKIEDLNAQITAKETQIEETKLELEAAEQTAQEQYEAMKKRIQFMYEKGDTFYADLLLNSAGFSEMLNKLEYISQLSKYDRDMLTKYESIVEYVTLCKEELESEQAVLDETRSAAQSEQISLEQLIDAKQVEIAAYESDISNKQKLIDEYENEIEEQTSIISELEAAVAADRASLAQARVYDGGLFCWPAPSYSRISDDYGYRLHPILNVQQFHSGVDMAAPGGSDILAAYDGEVVSASYNASMGNYIMIDHGDSLYTVYMHAQTLLVSQGQEVTRGQKIATVGTTGRSTGNHLHFSVRLNGSYVSPWSYISIP